MRAIVRFERRKCRFLLECARVLAKSITGAVSTYTRCYFSDPSETTTAIKSICAVKLSNSRLVLQTKPHQKLQTCSRG